MAMVGGRVCVAASPSDDDKPSRNVRPSIGSRNPKKPGPSLTEKYIESLIHSTSNTSGKVVKRKGGEEVTRKHLKLGIFEVKHIV